MSFGLFCFSVVAVALLLSEWVKLSLGADVGPDIGPDVGVRTTSIRRPGFDCENSLRMHDDSTTSEAHGGWVISFAFWLTLLAAAGLYGLVALSPKLLTFLELRRTHHNIQVRLVGLENEVQDLQTIVESLEHDPDFVRKLAQVEFGAAKSDEERIAVDEPLQLDMHGSQKVTPIVAVTQPWYESLVRPFATNRDLRSGTLLSAVVLLLLAFVGLQPTPSCEPLRASPPTERGR